MIEIKLKEVCEKKGIKNAYQFQKITGFAPPMANRIYKSKWKRLDLSTLNTICNALECEASDIIKFTPDKE